MNVFTFYVVTAIISTLLLLKLYFKRTNNLCKSTKRLNGKTCLVTGGTAGMGIEIAKDFARRGARVIVACPFEKEGEEALKLIQEETNSKNVVFKLLNLASLESTKKFAEGVLKVENRLDILVNNAGVGAEHKITEDGLNFTMQINYYGHFLLTMLLLPLLKKTGSSFEKSRIVNTTSLYNFIGTFEPGKMNRRNYWNFLQYYANSKLCLLMFSRELTKRLQGHNVVVNSIDPGAVGTTIFTRNFGVVVGLFLMVFLQLFVKTPWEGAQTALHAALADEVENISGEYFRNCEVCQAKKLAYDDEAAKKLWDESVQLVKLDPTEVD